MRCAKVVNRDNACVNSTIRRAVLAQLSHTEHEHTIATMHGAQLITTPADSAHTSQHHAVKQGQG